MTSPQLVINEGDILALRASKEYETGFLRLYASSDQGESWTLVSDFAEEMKAETMKTLVVSGMEAGKTMLRFDGSYANLEIINGFHIDDNAPKMRLTMEGEAVNDNDSIGFGKIHHNGAYLRAVVPEAMRGAGAIGQEAVSF